MTTPLWRTVLGGILLWHALCLHGLSSESINFKHLKQEDGLSQSSIYSILEDNRGFMWFGSQDGLNKFDGYSFTVYRFDPRDAFSISGNYITTLYNDQQGAIWAGTMSMGLNRFDPSSGRFYRYRRVTGTSNSLCNDGIRAFLQDAKGNYWIGTLDGLNRLDASQNNFSLYKHRSSDSSSISANHITALLTAPNGTLWIGTQKGLNHFDPATGKFEHYLKDHSISALYRDAAGYLWVGTQAGLLQLEPVGLKITRYLHVPENPNSLSHNEIHCMAEDSYQNLWVGTLEGLNQYDRRQDRFTRYQITPDQTTGLSFSNVLSLYQSRSGTFWIGTHGGGVDRIDRTGTRFTTYRFNENESNNAATDSISSIFEDTNKRLWIGYDSQVDRVERSGNTISIHHYKNIPGDDTSIGEGILNSILEDRDGALWFGTEKSGLHRKAKHSETFTHFRHDPNDPGSLSSNIIGALYEDNQGRLWVGTHGAGLNVRHRETGQFTHYRYIHDNPRSLSHDMVLVIHPSHQSHLWIGTAGGGLNKFEPNTGLFTTYQPNPDNASSGPSNDFILSIYEDHQGIVWVGTFGGGLNRFDPANESFSYVMEKDGLPNDTVYGILEDDRGYLWLSTNKGISQYDPRTGRCKNYSVKDGLQSNEFNSWAYFKSPSGEFFFGGIFGISAFFPSAIEDNPHVPPIVLTDFRLGNQSVVPGPGSLLQRPIDETSGITISYRQNTFSFEFAALNYSIPEKNQYAYKMEGFDRDWNPTTAAKRFATYTNLDPGEYVFRVRGSNNDGVWNMEGVSVNITITPPLTRRWWFRLVVFLLFIFFIVFIYRYRTRELAQQTRLMTEMQTARNAQMSIMPSADPQILGYEISGLCVPANEVGGDFFDYLWLDDKKTRFAIAIGDVSGKAMKAAMTAILSSGILYSKAAETDSIQEIMNRTNRLLHGKTDKRMFTALCLAAIDIHSHRFTFSNGGLSHPVLKSANVVTLLRDGQTQFPLGVKKDSRYREKVIPLKQGDVLLLFTDGLTETQDNTGRFYEYTSLLGLLEKMDTALYSASQIKEQIIDDIRAFAGTAPQHDDMTIVVIKVLEDKKI